MKILFIIIIGLNSIICFGQDELPKDIIDKTKEYPKDSVLFVSISQKEYCGYYLNLDSNIYRGSLRCYTPKLDIDYESFKVLNTTGYSRDKNNVYLWNEIFEEADASTFFYDKNDKRNNINARNTDDIKYIIVDKNSKWKYSPFGEINKIEDKIVSITLKNKCDTNCFSNLIVYNNDLFYKPITKNDGTFIFEIDKKGKFFLKNEGKFDWNNIPFYEFNVDDTFNDTLRLNVNCPSIFTTKIEHHPHPLFNKCENTLNGFYKEYYDNGNIRIIGNFKNGHPIDSVILNFPNGKPAFTYFETIGNPENNVLTQFFPNGIILEEIIRTDSSVTANTFYQENGNKRTIFYNSLLKDVGYSIDYSFDGIPITKIVVKEDNYRAEYEWDEGSWKLVYEEK